MTIKTYNAARLATSYHDVMVMVERQTAFHLSPMYEGHALRALEDYLHWSQVTGIKLHNAHWEASAREVAERLDARRRQTAHELNTIGS